MNEPSPSNYPLKGIQEFDPRLTVVNIVAIAQLNQFVNLEKLVHKTGLAYDPTVYRCAYLKDERTWSKVIIFATGKMISAGTNRLDNARFDLEPADLLVPNWRAW